MTRSGTRESDVSMRAGVVVAAVVMLAGVRGAAAPPAEAARLAAAGIGGITWDLVRAAGEGNVVLSPASVWEALAMTHQGARAGTAEEIAGVLGMPDDREAVAAAAAALRDELVAARGAAITLDVANRLWVQRGQPLERDFTAALERRFNAGAGTVDFAGAAETARGEINRWVAERTRSRIPELLGAGAVTPLTRLVLTNAVALDAPWARPFDPSATRQEAFRLADGTSVDVPFMSATDRLEAGRVTVSGVPATVCEVPYAGRRLALVLVVPEAVDGLRGLLGGLDGDWRTAWADGGAGDVRPRSVALALPRWTARKPISLGTALRALGMRLAFEAGRADLSGIDGTRELFVTAVLHEGFVDVSEKGTEAAAATGVVVGVRSALPAAEEPLIVRADRPFAWAIIDRGSGVVLFAGTVADPRG